MPGCDANDKEESFKRPRLHADPEQEKSSPSCAICFETVEETVSLPCECKAEYCHSCWDHALAGSFRSGRARCPTCRMPVRVDVEAGEDQLRCRLRFSRDTRTEHELRGSAHEREVERLAAQARPVQLQLLRRYAAQVGTTSGTDEAPAPLCVCRKELTVVGLEERTRGYGMQSIICDLCDKKVRRGDVWTCSNGYDTVLHPSSYDVCSSCFRHATTLGEQIHGTVSPSEEGHHNDALVSEEEGESEEDEEESSDSASGPFEDDLMSFESGSGFYDDSEQEYDPEALDGLRLNTQEDEEASDSHNVTGSVVPQGNAQASAEHEEAGSAGNGDGETEWLASLH